MLNLIQCKVFAIYRSRWSNG